MLDTGFLILDFRRFGFIGDPASGIQFSTNISAGNLLINFKLTNFRFDTGYRPKRFFLDKSRNSG